MQLGQFFSAPKTLIVLSSLALVTPRYDKYFYYPIHVNICPPVTIIIIKHHHIVNSLFLFQTHFGSKRPGSFTRRCSTFWRHSEQYQIWPSCSAQKLQWKRRCSGENECLCLLYGPIWGWTSRIWNATHDSAPLDRSSIIFSQLKHELGAKLALRQFGRRELVYRQNLDAQYLHWEWAILQIDWTSPIKYFCQNWTGWKCANELQVWLFNCLRVYCFGLEANQCALC